MKKLEEQLLLPTPVERFHYLSSLGPDVLIKRDDLIHPHICGNKYRKLKHNLIKAVRQNATGLITYGGPYSNHLVAVAAGGNLLGLPTVGIVRGYSIDEYNPTIQILRAYKMQLHLVAPSEYRLKEESDIISDILVSYEGYYDIPEGGTNDLALLGVQQGIEEVGELDSYDYILLPIGTGGTLAGILRATNGFKTKVLAVSPFKSNNNQYAGFDYIDSSQNDSYEVLSSAVPGRFGGFHPSIMETIQKVKMSDSIVLDPIYMAKAVRTLADKIRSREIPLDSKILVLHSGGLQGLAGYQYQYGDKL